MLELGVSRILGSQQEKKSAKEKAEEDGLKNVIKAVMSENDRTENKEKEREKARMKVVEERVAQRLLFSNIEKYQQRFPDLAKYLPPISIDTPPEELLVHLNMIKELRNSIGSEERVNGIIFMLLTLIENFVKDGSGLPHWIPPQFRMDLRNMSKYYQNGDLPALKELASEIDLEFPWIGRQGLLIRSMGVLGMSAFQTNFNNKMREAMQKLKPEASSSPSEVRPAEPKIKISTPDQTKATEGAQKTKSTTHFDIPKGIIIQ